MPDIGFVPAALAALLVVSGITVLAYRLGGRVWLWAIAVLSLVLVEFWVLWDRAEKSGTPYRYDGPLLLTIIGVGVPILVSAGVIQWLGMRSSNAGVQIAAASVAGVLSFFAIVIMGYVGWVFLS